jgi:tRNA threonylcarbamoyladenosine biosynthesis protein TsaE
MRLAGLPLADEAATRALGERLAGALAAGDVVRLEGDLGTGKSTLARALIGRLAGVADAPSPTFTLVETYETPDFLLWHFDLYRLEKPEEVWELGLEEALDGGVLLIEWPERIEGLLLAEALTVRIEVKGAGRRAMIEGGEIWRARLAAAGIA